MFSKLTLALASDVIEEKEGAFLAKSSLLTAKQVAPVKGDAGGIPTGPIDGSKMIAKT